jgi:hypothetical protein
LCISQLQACVGQSYPTTQARDAATSTLYRRQAAKRDAVPMLINVPQALVQRIAAQDSAAMPATQAAENVARPAWIFDGMKDGSLPEGSILPPDVFQRNAKRTEIKLDHASSSLDKRDDSVAVINLGSQQASRAVIASVKAAPTYQVSLYASSTTSAFFAVMGVDYQHNIGVWNAFMDRHEIAHVTLADVAALQQVAGGVLILPSAVALDDAERQAIQDFRKRGGSVLATWLSGVRGVTGEWTDFDFMSTTLNTTVVGDTRLDKDDVYINPYGDTPITHELAAGLRIWTERVEGWYPLRLDGVNSAAQLADWSRTVRADKPSSVISFNERIYAQGYASRVVLLGYPERLWLSADPLAMDAIAYDALMWLSRRNAAYIGTWPAHHRSALVLAVDAADGISESENRYADLAESLTGHASYYVLTQQLKDTQQHLLGLQNRGHEIAYLGDQFASYAGLSKVKQEKRVALMLSEAAATSELHLQAGIHPPMEGYDATTMAVLAQNGYKYLLGDMSSSESRLPSFVVGANDAKMLVLPRTQNGPDDVLGDETHHEFKDFLAEFSQSERMGGLNVVRIPSGSIMDDQQWKRFSTLLQSVKTPMWTATAMEVATWWHERDRVSVSLDDTVVPALLTVRVEGQEALQQDVNLIVNLPYLNAGLTFVPDDQERAMPTMMRRDVWRMDVALGKISPGVHHWFLKFSDTKR